MQNNIKRITVLMGGWSPEKEVSIKSGEYVATVLKKMGYEVYQLYVEKDLKYITEELYKSNPDFIFNLLHGVGGEDGIMQGILEVFGKPYSNSNVLSSAVCFNKSICKKIAKLSGANIVNGFDIMQNEIRKLGTEIPIKYPFVIKPVENGSSVGVFLIFNESDLENLKNTDWTFGEDVMIEDYIEGREFSVLVINGKAIGAIEIMHKNKFYDYASKYEIGGSAHISSFELNQKAMLDMYSISEKIFKACKCKGAARAEFIYDNENIYFLEINTQTGMTELSIVPDIARFNNISMEKLLEMHF
ncbi:MAG: D-alanine--D-alanine ligase [Holosporales bacterium]|jgi:D-alanine-D-alanine ligase|nr:D-alanine--D-alanine ligase [Holosporales bacterium]